MATTDRARLDLHRRLEATLGAKEADTLMAHLPPVTWQHITTKDDLDAQSALLRSELHVVSTEFRSEMRELSIELRSEMRELSTELRSEMRELSIGLRADMGVLAADLRSEMHQGFTRTIRWMTGLFAAWSAVMIAAIGVLY
jgi:hypothetical protein